MTSHSSMIWINLSLHDPKKGRRKRRRKKYLFLFFLGVHRSQILFMVKIDIFRVYSRNMVEHSRLVVPPI